MALPLAASRTTRAAPPFSDMDRPVGPPADPIDFYAFAGPMTPEPYSLTDDLMKLVGKPELQDELRQLPRPTLTVVGSSTERDLQGDRMTLTALEDMVNCDANQSIWLNHDYMLPNSLFGSLQGRPTIKVASGFSDMEYRTDVEVLNPDAVTTWLYIQRGRRLGSSVGVMVLAYTFVDAQTGEPVNEDDLSFMDIIMGTVVVDITHVRMVEQSIVGIPANQRSWVENAIKGVFQRTHNPKLAPIVRGLFPERYANLLSGVADPKLRQQLAEIQPRTAPTARVYWVPGATPDRQFTVQQGKRSRTTPREAIAALLFSQGHTSAASAPATIFAGGDPTDLATLSSAVPSTGATATPDALPPEVPIAPMPDADDLTATDAAVPTTTASTPDLHTDAADPDLDKDATGKADWPLGERDAAWDGGAAHGRIVEWAGGADDPDVGKLRSVHFYSPGGDDGQSVSKYKLLFCDVVGGSIKAMPRAIMACWGGHGVEQTTGIPDDEKEAIKKKLSAYAARMRKEFDDDTIAPPWDKEDGATPDLTASASASASDAAIPNNDTTNSGATPDAVKVHADGTHDAFTGTHSHSHSAMGDQGGDDMHDHEHSHDADSNHGHSHDKAGEPEVTAGVPVADNGTHPPFTGSHTHDHQDGQGGMHGGEGHEHSHDGDADHGHAHTKAATAAAPAPDLTVSAQPADAQATLLATYQQLLAPLGFSVSVAASGDGITNADGTPDAQKCSWSDQTQYQIAQGLVAIDAMVDGLLCEAGIADNDAPVQGAAPMCCGGNCPCNGGPCNCGCGDDCGCHDGDGDADDAGAMPMMPLLGYSLSMLARGLRLYSARATKEGRRNSEADAAHIQAIHDHCMSLTNGECCKGAKPATSASDDGATVDRDQQQGQDANGGNANPPHSNDALTMALGADHLRALAADSTTWLTQLGDLTKALTALPELEARAKTLAGTIAQYQQDAATYASEVERMRDQVARLKDMPLPRPTHQQRTVTPTDPGLAGFDDFLGLRASARPVAYPNLAASPAAATATAPSTTTALYPALDTPATQAALVTEALAQTALERRAVDNRLCRHWPAGVGAGIRPPLTADQRSLMSLQEWAVYESGGDSLVPEPDA